MTQLSLIAPAKLNLFLHINGQRPDGYHELETLFVFLNYGDTLDFTLRDSSKITLECDIDNLAIEDNLVYRAATTLQQYSESNLGTHIKIHKRLPSGGGVGGGSSDAATTLLALNKLWQLNYSLDELAKIGVNLGADVPVFINGKTTIAHGIGDEFETTSVDEKWYLVVHPNVHVSTQAIFTHPDLPRNTAKLTNNWQQSNLGNDCEELVKKLYPEVEKTLEWLLKYGPSRMTGTGACCFVSFTCEQDAHNALAELPHDWHCFVAKSANISPAHSELSAKLN